MNHNKSEEPQKQSIYRMEIVKQMTEEQKDFLELIGAYLRREPYEPTHKVSWNRMAYYAGIHNCRGVLYYMAKKFPQDCQPEPVMMSAMKQWYLNNLVMNQVRESCMQEIFGAFHENGIPFCVFKGFVTRSYYPIPEMREMSDVDGAVAPEHLHKAHQVMVQLGAEAGDEKGYEWTYVRNGIRIEVHSNLFPENTWNDVDYGKYFENAMDYTVDTGKGYLELKPEYHFVFLMAHMAKHFYTGGTGVHMVTDVAVFLQQFDASMDWDWIWKELKTLRLDILAKSVIQLCSEWFDIGSVTVTEPMEESMYEELSERILEGGIFGFASEEREARRLRKGIKSDGDIGWMVSVRALIRNLFPDRRFMCRYLEALKTRPYLLPVAWVKRWMVVLRTRRFEIKGALKAIFTDSEEASKQYKLLKKLGMYKK